MMSLGLGNGAVFQLVPQCFGNPIGGATGFIGAIGGLGEFVLPTLLGPIKQSTGAFQLAFVALGGVIAGGARAAPRADGTEHQLGVVLASRGAWQVPGATRGLT